MIKKRKWNKDFLGCPLLHSGSNRKKEWIYRRQVTSWKFKILLWNHEKSVGYRTYLIGYKNYIVYEPEIVNRSVFSTDIQETDGWGFHLYRLVQILAIFQCGQSWKFKMCTDPQVSGQDTDTSTRVVKFRGFTVLESAFLCNPLQLCVLTVNENINYTVQ
jgi:hypothetical protein